MPRPSVSRGDAARSSKVAAPPYTPWADRAPGSLRLAIVLLFACAVTPVLLWLHPVGDHFVETDFYGGYAPGAREAYGYALLLHPDWGRAYVDFGNLDADQGDFAAARTSYESALRAGEDAPMLLRNLGVAYARTGDYARAEVMITRYLAREQDPQDVPFLAWLRSQRAVLGEAGTPR